MSITWNDVTAIAPALSSVAAVTQTAILADVALEVRLANWVTAAQANRASKYLAAHLGTLTQRGGNGGSIQSQTVGQVSVTYASGTEGTMLGSTSFGQEYQRLKRLYFGGPWVF